MSRMSRSSVMLKKEIKMSFLKDVFQIADEIKQNQEKFKSAVETSFHQLDVLVRPYLSEVQNETLSEILEGLVASVAEHSFQIGYSSAMQTFAEAAAALEAGAQRCALGLKGTRTMRCREYDPRQTKNRLTCCDQVKRL